MNETICPHNTKLQRRAPTARGPVRLSAREVFVEDFLAEGHRKYNRISDPRLC